MKAGKVLRTLLTVAAIGITASCTLATAAQTRSQSLPNLPDASHANSELATLTIKKSGTMAGYSREKFPHWISQGDNCDTREVVLKRDGDNVTTDSACRAVSGNWRSPYDSQTFTSAYEVDIDNMVPLANAWVSGASTWSQTRRRQFANDLTNPQLLAVSASSNRSKGDQSPDEWLPPNIHYWCTYSQAWIHVKYVYKLTITHAEHDKLAELLAGCPA